MSSTTRFFSVLSFPKGSGWLLSATLFPLANALLCEGARKLPVFMDSVFTILAAALFGPAQGLVTGLLTNGWIEVFNGFTGRDLPFALCGAASALIVGAFAKGRPAMGPGRLGLALVAVTLTNAVLGATIATFVFGGATGAAVDTLASGFALVTDSILSAAFLARLPTNLADKAIAFSIAFGLVALLRKAERRLGKAGQELPVESCPTSGD